MFFCVCLCMWLYWCGDVLLFCCLFLGIVDMKFICDLLFDVLFECFILIFQGWFVIYCIMILCSVFQFVLLIMYKCVVGYEVLLCVVDGNGMLVLFIVLFDKMCGDVDVLLFDWFVCCLYMVNFVV